MDLWIQNGFGGSDLWREVDGFLREGGRADQIVPAADVVEDGEGYHFHFEMAGIAGESIDVRVDEGNLVVEGERKRPEWPKEAEIHRTERRYGHIMRSFTLPDDASHEDIRALYRDGVLEVTVAKRPETKPLKIKVQYEN